MRQRKYKPKSQKPSISNDAQMSIILALGLTVVPHIVRLPVWLTLLISAILVYKLATLRYPKLILPRMFVTLLAIVMVAAIGLHYSTLFGRDAGVSLLVGMLFLKLFETRNYRDAMIMLSMSYFVIITNFFYTQSVPTAVYMLFVVAYITMAIISLNAGPATIHWREKLRLVVPMTVMALPLMLLLFVLFPRIPGPLWGLPKDVYSSKSGLSDTMTPGDISQLALSNSVAFRVKFKGDIPDQEQLYWRAIVMHDFDGRSWRPRENWWQIPKPNIEYLGKPVEYTVTLEPHHQRWLFSLEMPDFNNIAQRNVQHALFTNASGQIVSAGPIINLTQYSLTSYPEYTLGNHLSKVEREVYLALPDYNPRTVAMGRSLRDGGNKHEDIVKTALLIFNSSFTYTLRPPILGKHTVDEFLFDTKRGFCEHFSSAFTVLMRAAGIPARVVTGYQGGELNPLGDYVAVRQSDAHAWSEVWLQGRGWVRIDPTSAVSPERIERNLDQAIPAGENPRFLLRRHSELLTQLGLVWDSINNRWNEWILGYGPEMQNLFLNYLGIQNTKAYNLVLILTITLAVCLAIIAFISIKRARRIKTDKVQKLYLKLCRKLARAGYTRKPYDGPMTYLNQIEANNVRLALQVKPAFQMYIALRYRAQHRAASYEKFQHLVRQFKPEQKNTATNQPAT